MLDVVLYRINSRGMIALRARPFGSIDDLARFFASDRGRAWEWAEIHRPESDPLGKFSRYSAPMLRALVPDPALFNRAFAGPTP